MIDLDVINYLEDFKVAKTETLEKLFYKNKKYTQRRLLQLYKDKELDRDRDFVSQQFTYWIKGNKPKQLKHSLLLTDFHAKLSELVDVQFIRPAFKIYNIIPDGFVVFKHNGLYYSNFIEIQLSPARKMDLEKYKHLLYSDIWKKQFNGVFPRIIFVSDRKIDIPNDFKVMHIKQDLSDIEKVII